MTNTSNENIFTKEIVYKVDEMGDVFVKQNVKYTNTDNELIMDIYYPKNTKLNKLNPAVIFVTGYSDPGFKEMTGYKFKEVSQYTSWAKLIAASGFIAIAYTNKDPALDINILLQYLFDNGASLGIDRDRICLWACSGNTPNAMAVLANEQNTFIKCAVLCYGYMPDIGESTITSDAAKQFHFVNPILKLSVDNFPSKTPMLIIRAGKDEMPGLNFSIDKFITNALSCNLPFYFLNISDASHAFDIMDNKKYSHDAIKNILSFMKLNLGK